MSAILYDKRYWVAVLHAGPEDNSVQVTQLYSPSKEEVGKYELAVAKLNRWLKVDDQTFAMFQHACNIFNSKVHALEQAFRATPTPSPDQAIFELNADFLSVLNFMRSYLDYAEAIHHKGLSDSQKKTTVYKRLTTDQFNKKFAYRFCYKLRNFAQHCGFPLTGFYASAELSKQRGAVHYNFEVFFDVKYLLENYDSWGAKLTSELSSGPHKIDALQVVDDLYYSISELRMALLSDVVERLDPEYKIVQALLNHTKGHEGTPVLMHFKQSSNPIDTEAFHRVVQEPIPANILSLMDKVKEQKQAD